MQSEINKLHYTLPMNNYKENAFIFSTKYRLLRHVAFWVVHSIYFTFVWRSLGDSVSHYVLLQSLWLPVHILYCYPIMYWFIPGFLLKEKYLQFTLILLFWSIAGWLLNALFRSVIFIPMQEYMHSKTINRNPWQQGTFLAMSTTAGITSLIVLFKYWMKKQRAWMQAEKDKVVAELQLLKAQVHPHFLFNTLNNIYSFSLENSPKTPQLILKLSSLLSYILYDCRSDDVLLEKEINIMRDYIDLEKERYGNKLEVSINMEGDIKNKLISPLLLLPFLENAFKHGTSEQLEKPWLSVVISVKQNTMKCKIVNSKNEDTVTRENGIGLINVKKRLAFLYPGVYELKIDNEFDFFVVSLSLQLKEVNVAAIAGHGEKYIIENVSLHEAPLPVN